MSKYDRVKTQNSPPPEMEAGYFYALSAFELVDVVAGKNWFFSLSDSNVIFIFYFSRRPRLRFMFYSDSQNRFSVDNVGEYS